MSEEASTSGRPEHTSGDGRTLLIREQPLGVRLVEWANALALDRGFETGVTYDLREAAVELGCLEARLREALATWPNDPATLRSRAESAEKLMNDRANDLLEAVMDAHDAKKRTEAAEARLADAQEALRQEKAQAKMFAAILHDVLLSAPADVQRAGLERISRDSAALAASVAVEEPRQGDLGGSAAPSVEAGE